MGDSTDGQVKMPEGTIPDRARDAFGTLAQVLEHHGRDGDAEKFLEFVWTTAEGTYTAGYIAGMRSVLQELEAKQ